MKFAGGSVLRTIRRLAPIALFGAALLALYVPTALAGSSAPAASATTLPATHVTQTSAVLNGLVDTRGQRTFVEFQYGATTVHDHSTSLSEIPAGGGTFRASATITGLRANTTYHFRVIAISGTGSNYVEVYYAATRDFTTKPWHGALLLVRKRLHVSRQVVGARLMCASKRACAGRLSISTRAGSPGGTVICATKSFRVGAGRKRMVRARISQGCLASLASAHNHRLKAGFSSTTRTGQRGQSTPVELILG
jgi:hypothetical protein